jgi:hypothetical protein
MEIWSDSRYPETAGNGCLPVFAECKGSSATARLLWFGFAKSRMTLFLSILSYRQAWGAETFEDFLKKLRNFPGIAPLDVAAVQHVQGLAVTK